jgi:hypothetical protein
MTLPQHVQDRYRAYLKSPEWRGQRRAALLRAAYRCQICCRVGDLEIHHNTYSRLGHELPADIIALCGECHARNHHRLPGWHLNMPLDPVIDIARAKEQPASDPHADQVRRDVPVNAVNTEPESVGNSLAAEELAIEIRRLRTVTSTHFIPLRAA